jgi:hypothetical protein
MSKLNPDKLPKGTEVELRLLLRRVLLLEAASVYIGRSHIKALQRTIQYLNTHPIESGKA